MVVTLYFTLTRMQNIKTSQMVILCISLIEGHFGSAPLPIFCFPSSLYTQIHVDSVDTSGLILRKS